MIDRRLKFRHIRCFVEINRQQSMKKAAEKLFLTQPAISKTLKELETIIGTALLTRSRAGIALTKQGEVFLHFAEMSVASIQQGLDGVERVGREGRARLNVGALPSVAASLMPGVASEFSELGPDITLNISDGFHAHLIDQLKLGHLDLVLGRMGPSEIMQGISFTQLYDETVEFVVRPDHPFLKNPNLDEVGNWPLLYPAEHSVIRPIIERFLIANGVGELPNRIETVSGAFGRVYTRRSDAIWIISAGVVANELAEGRLVRLPFDMSTTKGPVGLMARPDDDPSPQERIFRLAVQNTIAVLDL